MKKILTLVMCMLTAAVSMAQGVVFEPEGTTLEQASAKAKAENKLIFLDCFTQWCGPCKKMSREVFPQEKVGAVMNPKFVSLKIDMESAYGAPLAKKLQITAYPTFIIFNADAQEISRFLGFHAVDAFLEVIEEKMKQSPFILDMMVVGADQKYAAAVIAPDFDMLKDWCKRHGVTAETKEEMVADKTVVARYQKVMDKYNAELGVTEQVKKFVLVTDTWSEANKMLTPTQKLIRRNVAAAYKEQIEALFK